MAIRGIETYINQNQFEQKAPVTVEKVVTFAPGEYLSCRIEDHLHLCGRGQPAYAIFIRPG